MHLPILTPGIAHENESTQPRPVTRLPPPIYIHTYRIHPPSHRRVTRPRLRAHACSCCCCYPPLPSRPRRVGAFSSSSSHAQRSPARGTARGSQALIDQSLQTRWPSVVVQALLARVVSRWSLLDDDLLRTMIQLCWSDVVVSVILQSLVQFVVVLRNVSHMHNRRHHSMSA